MWKANAQEHRCFIEYPEQSEDTKTEYVFDWKEMSQYRVRRDANNLTKPPEAVIDTKKRVRLASMCHMEVDHDEEKEQHVPDENKELEDAILQVELWPWGKWKGS